METFYKNMVYDICQLIKQKKYKRSISLCKFLLQKGFRTNQLIVMLSYATKMVYGSQKGLEVLKQHENSKTNIGNNKKQEEQQQSLNQQSNPLIQIAKMQYNIQLSNINQASQSLNKILTISQQDNDQKQNQSIQQNQTQLCQLLHQLKSNYSSIIAQQNQSQNPYFNQVQQTDSIIQSLTQQINSITSNYIQQKDKISQNQQNQLYPQIILKYGEFYLQYEEIKQKILLLLSNELKIDQRRLLNFNVRKRQQQIKVMVGNKDNDKNLMDQHHLNNKQSVHKIKKQGRKQLFFKDVKPISFTSPSAKLNDKNKLNQNNIQLEKYLIELKILLKLVNKFISFFKSKLTEYQNLKNKNQQNSFLIKNESRIMKNNFI